MFSLQKSILCLKFMLMICSITIVHTEFYSSVHEMIKVVKYENVFIQQMQKFITANENKLDFLKARLADFERERDEAQKMGDAYMDSPINKYMLIKRLTFDWERIENLMQYKSGEKHLQKLNEFVTMRHKFPNETDLEGTVVGLLRLQDIYRLKTRDIADSVLQNVRYDTPLKVQHIVDIGKVALQNKQTRLGHSWLQLALELIDDEYKNDDVMTDSVEKIDVLYHLAKAKVALTDYKGANETFALLQALQPENTTITLAYEEFSKAVSDDDMSKTVDLTEDHNPIPKNVLLTSQEDRYKLTCSGHITQSPTEERDLRCGYLTETHPFLTIAPLKVEELNHDPLLVVYYDVISDNEIEIVKGLVDNRIVRATVMGLNHSIVSPVRTSQFAFIPVTTHKVLQVIDERVQDMTNLNMTYSEDHQFANYGIGGHYGQHHDWFHVSGAQFTKRIHQAKMGNRIATVLFYLTDVEQGGGTAFPYMKRLLMPKKGSAAFWYNLHASGVGDDRTLHGACPIIVGSKWVQNRWIREYFQERRPCELFNDQVTGPF